MPGEFSCDLLCDLIETVAVHQREDCDLDRRHRRREAEHPPDLTVHLVLGVAVLQGNVYHPVNAVRGFYDVGHHLLATDLFLSFLDLVEVCGDEVLLAIDRDPRTILAGIGCGQGFRDGLCPATEPGAEHPHIRYDPPPPDQFRLIVGDKYCH